MSTLLELAAGQLERGDSHATRRACWLARSAMEEALDALLAAKGIDIGPRASTRSKLTCLEVAYADNPSVPARAEYAWSRLSEACHQHAYALSPTYAEARHLIDVVESMTNREEVDAAP